MGTGNKSERLLGYFTWHADDSPPINPLGDLFKTQVWALARHLGLPAEVVDKPATADLIHGQTDEDDLGVSYPEADLILHHLLNGRSPAWLARSRVRARQGGHRAPPPRGHALEAEPAHRGHAVRHDDRGVVPAAGGLLSMKKRAPRSSRSAR